MTWFITEIFYEANRCFLKTKHWTLYPKPTDLAKEEEHICSVCDSPSDKKSKISPRSETAGKCIFGDKFLQISNRVLGFDLTCKNVSICDLNFSLTSSFQAIRCNNHLCTIPITLVIIYKQIFLAKCEYLIFFITFFIWDLCLIFFFTFLYFFTFWTLQNWTRANNFFCKFQKRHENQSNIDEILPSSLLCLDQTV